MGGAARGQAGQMNLTQTAFGHPFIRWNDFLLEADVYKLDGQPMYVHIICPRCHNALKIDEDHKAIFYERHRAPKFAPFLAEQGIMDHGGSLSIEPFECTWELGPDRQHFGIGLCRWRVAIDNNIAKDV